MRITGGTLRGRTLKAPNGMGTRPTADRVREALFNIIAHHDWGEEIGNPLDGTPVLDAFAGTGALGIEALSRGASSCTFFEKDRKALQCLRENVALMKLDEVTCVMPVDVTKPPKFTERVQNSSSCQRRLASTLIENENNKWDPSLRWGDAAINHAASKFETPSLICLDPPYHKGLIEKAVVALIAQGWIAPHALLVCETARDEMLNLPNCRELLERAYGDTTIRFYAHRL
ncbi:MAG: RsmD family RNA methyltransferase [Alphaproteobacteria bacterium]|nr:RsmD family RNA methyltransferase [Alphaproteobacteria bacterium]